MDAGYPHLVRRFVPRGLDDPMEFGLRLPNDLLDPARVDSTVLEEGLQGSLGHLSADRIVGRDDDRLRGVVYDEVNAGRGFEGSNVPALSADDAPLEVLAR